MSMENLSLNLTRKYRPKKLDDVVGQDLVVRLLKNGLYRGIAYPVYLLSGNKGCGKTTIGRILAASFNCFNLSKFQNSPQSVSLPCLNCDSCLLFNNFSHPDFIEIDAASNTGVDNVRQIIDSSSFVPAVGKKRVYLIDEAHMLSKAAFNAFLKVLEEPPATACFILATTSYEKIIDTVRSRCFHLNFLNINHSIISSQLQKICDLESIDYEKDALNSIAAESGGSLRDAINLLEKVRLSGDVVNIDLVKSSLGLVSEKEIAVLVKSLYENKVKEVFNFLDNNSIDINIFYNSLVEYFGKLLTKSYVEKTIFDQDFIINALEIFYNHELLMQKSSDVVTLLKLILVKISNLVNKTIKSIPAIPVVEVKEVIKKEIVKVENKSLDNISENWSQFLNLLQDSNDPLITSVFNQAQNVKNLEHSVQIEFSQDHTFFEEWIVSGEKIWRPLLTKIYGLKEFKFNFTGPVINNIKEALVKNSDSNIESKKKMVNKIEKKLFLNLQDFPRAKELVQFFPGNLISADNNE